jgi:hypothetical protein
MSLLRRIICSAAEQSDVRMGKRKRNLINNKFEIEIGKHQMTIPVGVFFANNHLGDSGTKANT